MGLQRLLKEKWQYLEESPEKVFCSVLLLMLVVNFFPVGCASYTKCKLLLISIVTYNGGEIFCMLLAIVILILKTRFFFKLQFYDALTFFFNFYVQYKRRLFVEFLVQRFFINIYEADQKFLNRPDPDIPNAMKMMYEEIARFRRCAKDALQYKPNGMCLNHVELHLGIMNYEKKIVKKYDFQYVDKFLSKNFISKLLNPRVRPAKVSYWSCR